MTNPTLEDTQAVKLHTTTADALRAMDQTGVDVLPVAVLDGRGIPVGALLAERQGPR